MFVVIEGIDGAGKGLQRKELAKLLKANNILFEQTEFPDHKGIIYPQVIHPALHQETKMSPKSMFVAFALDQMLWQSKINKYINQKNKHFIADGYYSTNLAYQVIFRKVISMESALKFAQEFDIQKPDLTIFLDVDPKVAMQRKAKEDGHEEGLDMFEGDIKKQIILRKAFLKMIKPDAVKRGLIGEVFTRLERKGLKCVACRMIQATKSQAEGNYPGTKEWLTKLGNKTITNYENNTKALLDDIGTTEPLEIGKMIYKSLINYIMDGPVIISVWEGNQAIKVIEKMMGNTDPLLADIGSLRGDFGFDTSQFAVKSGRIVFRTLVHRSDSVEEAEREIKHWFGDSYKYLGKYSRIDYKGAFGELL